MAEKIHSELEEKLKSPARQQLRIITGGNVKLSIEESNRLKAHGLCISQKCDACGRPLNQTFHYTCPDREGCAYCSPDCRESGRRGEGLRETQVKDKTASYIVTELIAGKIYGNCEACGLLLRDQVKAMHIPGLPGLYHSLGCAEQAIVERGCEFCGTPLPSNSHRFCSDRCADEARGCQFGDGHRLVGWLNTHAPELVKSSEAFEELPVKDRECAHCGGSLAGKRRQARYCSDRCQKAAERSQTSKGTGERQTSQETPTGPLISQGVTVTQNAQTVALVG